MYAWPLLVTTVTTHVAGVAAVVPTFTRTASRLARLTRKVWGPRFAGWFQRSMQLAVVTAGGAGVGVAAVGAAPVPVPVVAGVVVGGVVTVSEAGPAVVVLATVELALSALSPPPKISSAIRK